jgi:hypothetical protein
VSDGRKHCTQLASTMPGFVKFPLLTRNEWRGLR